MAYTVKQLSALSKVTVRALHYYEELGLLRPAYYGENGYRYYEEAEVLQLQQILFFKKLGFSLKKIQKVLGRPDFDQLAALYSHKESLARERAKLGHLIKTVEKTINHIEGKKKMKSSEFFEGLTAEVKAGEGSESYYLAEVIVGQNVKPAEVDAAFLKSLHEVYQKMLDCMHEGREPASAEVQAVIKKHHTLLKKFSTATKEAYIAYAELYRKHPAFRKQLDAFDPELADFMARAMKQFAIREL